MLFDSRPVGSRVQGRICEHSKARGMVQTQGAAQLYRLTDGANSHVPKTKRLGSLEQYAPQCSR